MARFFFNFRQGSSYQIDELGCDFDTTEEAYLGAFTAAQDMWRELLVKRQDPLLCAFEVTDEEGRDLFTLPFVEVLEVCRGRVGVSNALRQLPPHIVQLALEDRARARKALSEVSSTVATARVRLQETHNLLAQVNRLLEP